MKYTKQKFRGPSVQNSVSAQSEDLRLPISTPTTRRMAEAI